MIPKSSSVMNTSLTFLGRESMSLYSKASYLKRKLSSQTPFFGMRLWIWVVAFFILFILLFFFIITFCFVHYRRRRKLYKHSPLWLVPKNDNYEHGSDSPSSFNRRLLPVNVSEVDQMNMMKPELQVMFPNQWSTRATSLTSQESIVMAGFEHFGSSSSAVSEPMTGNYFSLRVIELITNGFCYDNLIGHGEHGVVYSGMLFDQTRVAVKRLLSNGCKIEYFVKEADAIGQVRHKNLVKLLGYCIEEGYRVLVYEYVNNSNLHQWLHGSLGQAKPLTWTIRLNIIHGIAKGLAYLHEDIEPEIIHQNIKSSNILLDHQWNPKISDVSLSRLLAREHNHFTTCPIAKLGYTAEEHASPILWDKKSDVFSFGVLIMEIITGRNPVDHNQPHVYLIEWLKSMVADKKITHLVDPKMLETPTIKELKRITLVALRCVDSDLDHRPKMGEVIHMLEPRDLLLNDVK